MNHHVITDYLHRRKAFIASVFIDYEIFNTAFLLLLLDINFSIVVVGFH
jgi:hypothetical protein